MNDLSISRSLLDPDLHQSLIQYVYVILRGTSFPIAILVNFGTWPKAQIERYDYHDDIIWAFYNNCELI